MLVEVVADNSELFRLDARNGVLYQRTGASHRSAFWAGYEEAFTGVRNRLRRGDPSSDAAICYQAGFDFGIADRRLMQRKEKAS
jgi:hypothetical protein